MKFVQVIPIPVTYSRNLKSLFAERSRIVDLSFWQPLSFSLSLFEEVSNNWNEEARVYPAARYFREFILVAVFSRLDDHHPSYLGHPRKIGKAEENAGPTKILAPSPPLFIWPNRRWRRWRRHFCG